MANSVFTYTQKFYFRLLKLMFICFGMNIKAQLKILIWIAMTG